MAEPSRSLQLCPTRIDGAPVLFAHKVSQGQCQDRQRGQYHKCFTCVFNNAYRGKNGQPLAPKPAAAPTLSPTPAAPAAQTSNGLPVPISAVNPATRAPTPVLGIVPGLAAQRRARVG